MDPRTVISYSLLLCVIGDIRCDEASLRSSESKVSTNFTQIPDSDNSETTFSRNYRKVPNDLHDDSSEGDEVDGAPPDHEVPYSSHEDPEEPSTKPKYTKPGDWAKPKANVPLEFVPTKLYAQVRGTHTVKRLPREEAIKSAETAEEILAAPRLRAVVSKSKKNTIYTEERYEDAAYDHAGHIRDADFHEGFARKLEDQQNSVKGRKNKLKKNDKEDIKSDIAEEFNDYDDDYRDHAEESSNIEESSQKKRTDSVRRQYKKAKNLLQNSEIDPKQVTENEIEKLEEDLIKEYEESEKNTEKEVPENLKNSGSDDDESDSEEDNSNSRDYGSKIGKEIDESQAASRAMMDDIKIDAVESQNDEIQKASSTLKNIDDSSSRNSATTTELNDYSSLPGEFLSTPDYGKLFWDYYKTDTSIWDPQEASTPKVTSTTIVEVNKPVSESLTSVPSFPFVQSTIGVYDTFEFTPPSTELSSFSFMNNTDVAYPSATSFYESWKRRDRNNVNEDNSEHENFDSALNIETTEADNDPALSLQHGQSATTLIGPKKLSYTVIIRSNDKSTTQSPDYDHENYSKPREQISNENPEYIETLSEFGEQVNPQATNDFHAPEQDFTVIRPPLPVPLGQVTFADFLPDPYGSLVHPSVAHESGRQLGQEINGERDIYKPSESPYDYTLQNNVNPEASHVRHYRGPLPNRKRNHHYTLLTKLVPPSPMNRSKYAEYLGVKRNVRPKTRFDRSSRGVWPEIINFYRTVDQTFFGRRGKRSVEETGRTVREKVKYNSVVLPRENNLQERNSLNDEVNRLAAGSTSSSGLSSDDNAKREKISGGKSRKRRNDEDLFNETPTIAEEVINSEIESRFKDDEENSDDEDSLENDRGKIEIEVPAFNFTEVIENNKRQKAINPRPSQVQTLNLEKYPFYGNSEISRSDTALKYITNPRQVPRKTFGGTEFYDSRDKYLECADVEPDLEKVVPEEEEPNPDREQRGDQPRLRGLGDKLDCFRAKYFDENPLDNPLFLEKQVGQPRFPKDLDPAKFASRISSIKNNENEEQVIRRVSKKPEIHDLRRSGSKVHKVTQQANRNHRNSADENRSSGRGRIKHHRGRDDPKEYKKIRRPPQTTTEQPEVPVTPYQHEVYEDVMGTIKNLAGMYQTFGESVLSPSIQPNVNHLPANSEGKNWNSPMVHITEKPRGFAVRGMLPPQPSEYPAVHRYRITPYRTNRVSYGIRPRIETLPGAKGVKIGYFKTVRVHKRSLDDATSDMEAEESRTVTVRSAETPGNANQSTTPERIIYTIRDRFRHSKPRGNIGRNGKFTNIEAAGTEDIRRKEPRYNKPQRRKVPPFNEESATTSNWDESDSRKSEEPSVNSQSTSGSGKTPRQDFHDEPGELYKIQFSTPQRRQARPSDGRRREEDEQGSDEDTTNTTENRKYDVREDVEDNITTAPAIYKLQKYLESDPPGYSEAFGEGSTEQSEKYSEEENTPVENYEKAEKQEDEESEEEDEQIERPSESYVEEESSPNSEEAEDERDSSEKSESYKNSDDDEENEEEKEDPSKDEEGSHVVDGETEFMRFASRPFSPFESYDDPKYADLGPRISKPSFHHPTFEKPSSKYRSKDSGERKYSSESDDDSEESDRGKRSKYVFPWSHDEESKEEDAEESKKSQLSFERYEYPWEKRERLARERRRKQKEREKYEKLFAFPDSAEEDEQEEEQDASNSEIIRRRVYPWERYDMPSKKYRRVKTSTTVKSIDNDGMGSEYRPVTRFSSRYKLGRFHSNHGDDPIASGADPKEIRVSIMKSIENATDASEASKASDTHVESSTVPSKRNKRRKTKSSLNISTTSTTIRSVSNAKKPRVWRIASTTTKKPIRSHARRTNIVETELLKSGSQRKEVTTNPAGRSDLNSSVIVSSTVNRRNVRRRGQSANRSSTTTTARPLRRRLQKTTTSPEEAETSTTETVTEGTTTPSSKTVEHHSRFSKEEIITKTSYPRLEPEDSNDNKGQAKSRSDEKKDSTDDGKDSKDSMNERVEKVSIVTKETPEHIYRKEEIDKDGVKGMFVSIIPNNGTDSTKDSKTNEEEAKEMLKRFETSEDDERDAKESLGGFMHDSYLLANLLRQVPPYKNDWTLDENVQELGTVFEEEGSGYMETEDDEDEPNIGLRTNYVKDPNERLYFYVEK